MLKDLLKKLYPLRLAPVSPDTDKFVSLICKELPFKVHEFKSGDEYNGWVVPQNWYPIKAQIVRKGKLIYDGMTSILGVIGSSQSFKGKLSLDELKKHLFFKAANPDAIVYHCDLYYKVGKKNWGISVPFTFYNSLVQGEYEVDLETVHSNGTMKVCDYFIQGKVNETIVLNAHNCHMGQANDDISGVVVGIEVMKQLAKRKNHYSYRLIIAPEHFGTVFYLANIPKEIRKTFKCCMFLEMLGNFNRLALQETFTGTSELDTAAHHYLRQTHSDYFSDKFRKIVGNDETVWEAPGYEVPTISLSRWPYNEYHTNLDNDSIISEDMLQDSVKSILGIIDVLENNRCIKRKFEGLIALSNPKYNLYFSTEDPSLLIKVSSEQKKWNYLMDCLPRYFDEKTSILDIAVKHDLPFAEVHAYLKKFKEKDLIEFV